MLCVLTYIDVQHIVDKIINLINSIMYALTYAVYDDDEIRLVDK